ncbi:CDP-archaeol synthase [Desulfohalobiaceae bacterium Ax17]|uniref:CDP-archaeol synthase n=1 Tax=Desulfovulcanus ferrireducens TaxID=2831190 RepID=UPI00207BBA4A|nr:CDP-archaeol synthase [Desulfovulcanus ferrireducens]MBT8762820.1 CDP-archaeol synthase [Desulfovulcanus ferrireducens]
MFFLKLLFLLWLINFAPPFLAFFLEDRWNTPVDMGKVFWDKKPLFGGHKTIRGIIAAIGAGGGIALLFGFPLWVGLTAGILSMAGDLISSFIKRRFSLTSGYDVPGLDQLFEGLFPLLFLKHYFSFSWLTFLAILIAFCIGAYVGSRFYKSILQKEPFSGYPRPVKPRIVFKELISCRIKSKILSQFLNFEDALFYHLLIQTFFKTLGLYKRGMANALNFKLREVYINHPKLPHNFEAYTILFMSDLHLDGLNGLTERLQTVLEQISVDLCILGGDYRMATHSTYLDAMGKLKRVISSIKTNDGIIAVLGNHDCLEMVEFLEEIGVKVLLNDALPIEHKGQTIWIVGVDDPHYYQCHDLDQAFEKVPQDAFSIFVAHTPKIYKEAAKHGADIYLAGHTHAGQIQIPPIGPVFTHCPAPRKYSQGLWSYRQVTGFTTSGVGVSGVPVRFNCSGEVVKIRLKRKPGNCLPSRQEEGK